MSSGSSMDIPKPIRNCRTKVIKSLIFKNVSTPIDSPYLYKKSSVKGITSKYENIIPIINNHKVGINFFTKLILFFSFSSIAGTINSYSSLISRGIEIIIPISAATYICAKKA